jgi:NAD(P)-dependent dehydrogenase (short-subunit alcohol dehydrogenase family)
MPSDTSVTVIQWSSQGIGLQFARLLLKNTNLKVAALSRRPTEARDAILSGLDVDKERLLPLEVDVKKEDSLQAAAQDVQNKFGKENLRLLINVSGIARSS